MDVELRHLRAFVAVAQSRSFTRASEQLLISQPALSRAIQQLETALKVTLIDRSSRHAGLTDAGNELLRSAERIVADFDATIAAAGQTTTIRLGFSWLLPDPWAQDAVNLYEQNSGTTVTLVRCDDPLDGVRQACIDIALIRGEIRSSSTPVRAVHLFDEQRVAVCSEHSALASHSSLHWDDVPQWPLVVNVVSGTTGSWSWPPDRGPQRIVETANFDEWIESVAADRGIGVVPNVAMRRNIHPAVRFIPLVGAPATPVSLVFLPNVRDSLIRKFLEAAVAAAKGGE
jgi:DNA-binding transcriptional LysR family regulator